MNTRPTAIARSGGVLETCAVRRVESTNEGHPLDRMRVENTSSLGDSGLTDTVN